MRWPPSRCPITVLGGFALKGGVVAETATHIDTLVRLGVLGERIARLGYTLDELQEEFDSIASELGAPDIEDPRVQELLDKAKG